MAIVACYRWDRCDLSSGNIYTPTGDTHPGTVVLYSGVCFEKTITVEDQEPTDLSIIPSSQFFANCGSCSPISILPCDTLFISSTNEIYAYTLSSDTSVLLATGVTYDSDIAHSVDKLWINSGNNIDEYNFNLSPFYLIYNRRISVTGGTSQGLSSTNNNNILIGAKGSTDEIREIDITSTAATSTEIFQFQTDRSIAGDIALTDDGKYIITFLRIVGPSFTYYISQFDSNGNLEFDKLLSPTITAPYGVFVSNGEIYVCGNSNEIWHVDSTSPYNLTLSATTSYDINGASQIVNCVNVDFDPNVTLTPTPTQTQTPTITQTPTTTPTTTPTITSTPESTPTSTLTNTPTISSTVTSTPSLSLTQTPTQTSSLTPTVTNTLTPSPTSGLVSAIFSNCCTGEIIYARTYSWIEFGSQLTAISGGTCFQFVEYDGSNQGVGYIIDFQYVNCPSCLNANPCVTTPTPSVTPSVTPTPIFCDETSFISTLTDCYDEFCIDNLEGTNSIYNGTYSLVVSSELYNLPYYQNTVGSGFVYFKVNKWCLSNSPGGECIIQGPNNPLNPCPSFHESLFYSGECITTTTTTDPCNVIDFQAIFNCDVPVVTASVSPSVTPTPSLSPYVDPCLNLGLTATTYITTTTTQPVSTPTPTQSPQPPISILGSVEFEICCSDFICPEVYKIKNCSNQINYFTSQRLVDSNGISVLTGQTFDATIEGQRYCFEYLGRELGSPNIFIDSINEIFNNCELCLITPTPTVTPTSNVFTSTPTPTNTITPTKSSDLTNKIYVYSVCPPVTTAYDLIIQTIKVTGVSDNQVFRTGVGQTCYTYLGEYNQGSYFVNPSLNALEYSGNFFGNINPYYVFESCNQCQNPTQFYIKKGNTNNNLIYSYSLQQSYNQVTYNFVNLSYFNEGPIFIKLTNPNSSQPGPTAKFTQIRVYNDDTNALLNTYNVNNVSSYEFSYNLLLNIRIEVTINQPSSTA